ncbi:MAG: ribosome biogenesis GTPase Der [Alphaproteobacteria bacterium]|jgi:GTP-binding protein|nr:ribosome biogenesis GTPase Der [Alphaproteobacteria bacterium]MDP6517753.1 ribosome biogenesis GTPase Der [Alphaproteobacteria bacterium]
MPAVVAIVGRPNVGKSTLFNRLVGRRTALVDAQPGVTRDRREGMARLGPLSFTVVDTAGLEDADADSLRGRMRGQAETAVAASDLVLMVVDGRAGVTPLDRYFADLVRRSGVPVLVVVNKAEGDAASAGTLEAFALGLGDPVAISAQHGEGMSDLHDAVAGALAGLNLAADGESDDSSLRLAIIGRPNTGKSTLLNRLVGEARVLTGPEPGVTRDSIAVDWTYRGRPIQLIDTAGLRRRARVTERLEKLSVGDTLATIRRTHVAALTIDATVGIDRQDLVIANRVIDEGRALVIVANKWDLVADEAGLRRVLGRRIEAGLPQVRALPVVSCSGLTGAGVARLMAAVLESHEVWNRRLATAALNQWLEAAIAHHPPPLAAGRQIKIRYITQVASRPPRFALFANRPDAVPESYRRYLVNELRADFDLPGTPIRLLLRAGKNPYVPA